MKIRQATYADAPALTGLLAMLDYAGTDQFIDRRIKEQLGHPDARLLVAEDANQVLGFISLHFIPQIALAGDFCRISYLCVDDAARSKGIGALLEAAAVELARERGCDRIELHSHTRRARAHAFYARQGYAESPKYLIKMLPSG